MRRLRALLALGMILAAACATSPTTPGPRCADGSRPRFSGIPFEPFACQGDPEVPAAGSGDSLLQPGVVPDHQSWNDNELAALAGDWEGEIAFGPSRYHILISVRQSDYLVLKIGATDHVTQVTYRVRGELKGSRGRYNARIFLLDLPEWRLRAKAWIGKALPPLAEDLDRSLVVSYRHLAELHELRFKLDNPDRIRYFYVYRQARREPVQASGILTRADREPF